MYSSYYDNDVVKGERMFKKFDGFKHVIIDSDGTSLVCTQDGMLMQLKTPTRAVRRILTLRELYFLSRAGRDYSNMMIIDELNTMHAQFFEEV